MSELILTLGDFNLGLPRKSNLGFLTLSVEDGGADFPHSQILDWDGKTLGDIEMVPWNTVGLGTYKSTEALVAVGETGEVLVFENGSRTTEIIPGMRSNGQLRGPLRAARGLGDEVLAVGMDCQIYSRNNQGAWMEVDKSLRVSRQLADVPGLESVFGTSSENAIAVGWRGSIICRVENDWEVQNSPVNSILTDGTTLKDGTAIICGRSGTIVIGRRGAWETFDHVYQDIDFWGVGSIGDRIILSSFHGLFELSLKDRKLRPAKLDLIPEAKSFGRIGQHGEVLWSIGHKELLEFDGQNWKRLIS